MEKDEDIDQYLKDLELNDYSPRTIYNYRIDLYKLKESINKPFEKAVARDIKNYLHKLKKENNYTAKGLNRKISVFSSFYKYLIREDVVDKNIIEKIEKPKVEKRQPVYLTTLELDKFLTHFLEKPMTQANQRNYAIVNTLYYCGLRIDELVKLKLTSIQEREGKFVLRVIGKGNKERFVPINNKLKLILDNWKQLRYKSDSDSLFITAQGNITARLIQKTFRKVVKELALEKPITPHKLRHTFATQLLKKGVPIHEIKELLGHSKIETTMIYAHIDQSTLHTAIDKL